MFKLKRAVQCYELYLYTCRYTVSSASSSSPGSGYKIVLTLLKAAEAMSSKNTSSLECRIFIATATTVDGDLFTKRDTVSTSAGL